MQEIDEFEETRLVRPTWAKWLTRAMLLICGTLMAVVLLSQPKIVNKLERDKTGIVHRISDFRSKLLGEETTAQSEQAMAPAEVAPVVNRVLPASNTPIHRAGVMQQN